MKYNWNKRRTKPYTANGIKRLKCCRCGESAFSQWNICADSGAYRPLCIQCDLELNVLVMAWIKHPDAKKLLKKYQKVLVTR